MHQIAESICTHATVDAIYLYGSRAKNTAHETSDWDIAVIFSHYETDTLERLVRPQLLEAAVECELKLYKQISIVDLEIVPIYLQMAVLNHGIKWFDRNVPRVKRVEQSILSTWEITNYPPQSPLDRREVKEIYPPLLSRGGGQGVGFFGKKIMRDIVYEQALLKHQRDMLEMLNQYSKQNPNQWTRHDLFAIQRMLQIYIESFIGMARYLAQQKYNLSLSQSREALDELKNRADLSPQQHKQLLKIIGFRNILVYDYLDVNDAIVEAIIVQQHYLLLDSFISTWHVSVQPPPLNKQKK